VHHAQNHGQGVHVSFVPRLVRRFDYFWLGFIMCWVFFQGGPGVFYVLGRSWFCFNWLLLAGVRKYLRNHCPLAAIFGTKACKFAAGWFFICEIALKCFVAKRYSIIYRWCSSYRKCIEAYGGFPQPRGWSVCVSLLLYGIIDYSLCLTGIFYCIAFAMESADGIL
jgi:hypothetical protein